MEPDEGLSRQHCPYARDLREQIVNQHFYMHKTIPEIAATYGGRPCLKTIRNIVAQYLRDGTLELKGHKGCRHADRKFNEAAATALTSLVQANNLTTLAELAKGMQQFTGEGWHVRDVSRALQELGYVNNVADTTAVEADPELQTAFKERVESLGLDADAFVSVDEVAAVIRRFSWWKTYLIATAIDCSTYQHYTLHYKMPSWSVQLCVLVMQ
jgi:transposase